MHDGAWFSALLGAKAQAQRKKVRRLGRLGVGYRVQGLDFIMRLPGFDFTVHGVQDLGEPSRSLLEGH